MALLKEIETLARLHADGTLTQTEFAAAKAAILAEIPEAEEPAGPRDALPRLLIRCLLPPVLLGGLVYGFGIPGMLSLTLGVTVLAAIVVAQFRATA
ncbi:SHOCT domain-containing protein [Oceaniovalibus sp. ACAM 378]|uniref:SHOCT domain-containing protein n=1 Tax=Oceaniovalibus sp. ACAM 378 TaxID=2599923 RepID=UPI0011DBC258|nr:SHOCT domain-containing protein [Oceaniovalibus sp. ACAM 378]TYB86331.1 hypothetical protein FQ320_16395 [Oceaniovalibus sp. ACAM 378]